MLEIKNNGNIYIDGKCVDEKQNFRQVLMACLDSPIKIEDNVSLDSFIHLMYDINDFINLFFVDMYEAVRSLIAMGNLVEPAKCIEITKNLEESDGYLYINKTTRFNRDGGDKIAVGKLSIRLNEDIDDTDGVLKESKKVGFTLLDVLIAVFEDLVYSLRNEPILQ